MGDGFVDALMSAEGVVVGVFEEFVVDGGVVGDAQSGAFGVGVVPESGLETEGWRADGVRVVHGVGGVCFGDIA